MHRVHTRARRTPPPSEIMRTLFRLGNQRLRVLLWAWETLLPVAGPLPQIWHTFAMIVLLIFWTMTSESHDNSWLLSIYAVSLHLIFATHLITLYFDLAQYFCYRACSRLNYLRTHHPLSKCPTVLTYAPGYSLKNQQILHWRSAQVTRGSGYFQFLDHIVSMEAIFD